MRRILLVLVAVAVALAAAEAQKPTIKVRPAPYTSPVSGKDMYHAYCASCHGLTGVGDGPAASALKTAPPDLTILTKTHGGSFPANHVYENIKGQAVVPAHGSAEMPVWGPVFLQMSSHDQAQVQLRIDNLTAYIRSLQK